MHTRAGGLVLTAVAVVSIGVAAVSLQSQPLTLAIAGGTVIDGNGGPPLPDAVVLLAAGEIRAIGPRSAVSIPSGATIVDAKGKFLVPGLVDTNVHLSLYGGVADRYETLAKYHSRQREIVLEAAQLQLKHGVTTVRDSYGVLPPLVAVRDEIAAGRAIGPRILAAGNIVGWGGPYSVSFSLIREQALTLFQEQVNDEVAQGVGEDLVDLSPEELRVAIRSYLDKGPDFIKYGGTAHFARPAFIGFSPEAQRAIVEEAHKRGRVAETHATTADGMRLSIEAGIDLIQHPEVLGLRALPESLVRLIVDRKIVCSMLTNTITGEAWKKHLKDRDEAAAKRAEAEKKTPAPARPRTSAELRQREADEGAGLEMRRRNAQTLIKAGAVVTIGTDNYWAAAPEFSRTPKPETQNHGIGSILAIEGLVELGMTPAQAIVASTRNGAIASRGLDRFGTIEVGKRADLLILEADPLADITNLRKLSAVIRDGRTIDRERLPLQRVLSPPPVRPSEQNTVSLRVDAAARKGPMTPMWAFFGYDEPNYTYMKDGKKLLSELAELSPVPVFVRAHNLLTTGDGTPALKWGSTNAYTEDAAGSPRYDWTIVDRIFDTYVERKMKPLVEIGFMPEALSTRPAPYRHDWAPGLDYNRIYTGWAYPPRDYDKWRELVYQWVRHSVERYGAREVESWYWEVWNEPDIGYWRGTPEEYQKLYDYAADGLKRALPSARIGGPHVTGPNGARTQQILRSFIEHCLRGTNYATGAIGSPLDYVGFHAKGAPRVVDGHVRMGISNQLRAIHNGFAIVASFPELKQTPVVIGESDPEGCAACSMATNPENAYRNGTMYSSYTAAQIARTYELADLHKVNLLGSVTWAFEFENQPYFAGFRDLATNGIDKPVLNVFRMLGQMGGDRVAVESSSAAPVDLIRENGVRERPDVYALASRNARAIAVLVWNYHDDDLPAPAAEIELTIDGAPDGRPMVTQYRVDGDHGNAYEAWKRMGSPQKPTDRQYAELEKAGKLAMVGAPERVSVDKGRVRMALTLPRQGVALVKLAY